MIVIGYPVAIPYLTRVDSFLILSATSGMGLSVLKRRVRKTNVFVCTVVRAFVVDPDGFRRISRTKPRLVVISDDLTYPYAPLRPMVKRVVVLLKTIFSPSRCTIYTVTGRAFFSER